MTLVVRRDNLPHSISDYLIKEIEATPVITVRLETEAIDAHGGDRLDGLTLCDKRSGGAERVPADALFVLIGGEPCTQWLPKAVQPALSSGSPPRSATARRPCASRTSISPPNQAGRELPAIEVQETGLRQPGALLTVAEVVTCLSAYPAVVAVTRLNARRSPGPGPGRGERGCQA